jgi:hypothetical protein
MEVMKEVGNARARVIWEANVPPTFDIPSAKSDGQVIGAWIKDKYQYKKYFKQADPQEVTPCAVPLQEMNRGEREDFYDGKSIGGATAPAPAPKNPEPRRAAPSRAAPSRAPAPAPAPDGFGDFGDNNNDGFGKFGGAVRISLSTGCGLVCGVYAAADNQC